MADDRMIGDAAAVGLASNILTLVSYSKGTFGAFSEQALSACTRAVNDTTGAVRRGDLKAAESLLTSQAMALNAIFGELARRAATNMGSNIEAMDRYMKLAFKAQGQCRATLETLAAIKNPPVVFARQANFNNAGQMQVNNAPQAEGPDTCAHAATPKTEQTELLEASDDERMDTRTQGAAGRADPHLEAVGAVHRSADR